jgi:hypothetical protein
MLRAPAGTTIATIITAIEWQQHSVRGFLAGVVRKKLGLNLVSEQTDNGRVYRIKDGKALSAAAHRLKQATYYITTDASEGLRENQNFNRRGDRASARPRSPKASFQLAETAARSPATAFAVRNIAYRNQADRLGDLGHETKQVLDRTDTMSTGVTMSARHSTGNKLN